jgi:hypothetical protein
MPLGILTDKARQPTDADLRRALGKAHALWERLIADVDARIGPVNGVWGFTSATTGWGLRLRRKERVILYMTPRDGAFLVSFALGEKAVADAMKRRLPATLARAIESAPRYAEGRGVRVEVTKLSQLPGLVALAEAKNAN